MSAIEVLIVLVGMLIVSNILTLLWIKNIVEFVIPEVNEQNTKIKELQRNVKNRKEI